jgi:hypothetical protein
MKTNKSRIVFLIKYFGRSNGILGFISESIKEVINLLCWNSKNMAIEYAEKRFESGTSYIVISKTIEQVEDHIKNIKNGIPSEGEYSRNKLIVDNIGYRIVE